MSSIPSNPSDTLRRLNPHLYGSHPQGKTLCEVSADEPKMLRQSSKPKLNKTEADYGRRLRMAHPEAWVTEQAVTFRIGNGVRYTPDFTVFHPFGGGVDCHEVKGYMRDDAAVKLKVAASEYPFVKWTLAWKSNHQWQTQVVLP